MTSAATDELPARDGLFPGFRLLDLATPETTIRVRTGGSGPPLLLLHGYPQTHVMWHKVAPLLAHRFTLVCADLGGYGASGKPVTTPDHAPYAKRAMAADMVAVMQALGHEHFHLAGHDRGGRVAHRLAVDHPDRVTSLVTLDIAPTREMYANTTEAFARAYWHWFFLIQPAPFPERMIGADPVACWLKKCGSGSAGLAPFTPEALRQYLAAFSDPAVIHASCEDYRAAASIDIAHDDADEAADRLGGARMVECPMLALWGENGIIGRCFEPLELWRRRARDVRGRALPGGHYLAEELPEKVAAELAAFFA
jgi:haloacetate dehalogenase